MDWTPKGNKLAKRNELARTERHRAGEITPLTSLRGVAASCVVIFHMNYWFYLHQWQHDPGTALRTIFHVGYLNVDLFFVLSGYVITRSYLSWFQRPTLGQYGIFLSRRLARVWPLHLIALLLFVGARDCSNPATLAYNALMVHAWGFAGGFSCNYPSWSISCEWLVYIAFPCIAWLMMRTGNGRRSLLLAAVGLGGLGVLAYLSPSHKLDYIYDNDIGVARAICGFIVGGAFCRAFDHMTPRTAFDGLALLLAAAAAILAALGASDFWVVCLFGPLVVSIALSAGPVRWLLSLAPLVWVGEISYSMYMLHHFVIDRVVGKLTDIDTPLRVALTLALVIVISSLSYVWIEKPARQMGRGRLASFLSRTSPTLRLGERLAGNAERDKGRASR